MLFLFNYIFAAKSAIKCSAYKRLFPSIHCCCCRSIEMKHLLGKISFDLFVSIYEEIIQVNTNRGMHRNHVHINSCEFWRVFDFRSLFFLLRQIYIYSFGFSWWISTSIHLVNARTLNYLFKFYCFYLPNTIQCTTAHIIQPQPIRFLRDTDNMIVIYPIQIGVYRESGSSVLRNSHRWINNFRILNLYSSHEIRPFHIGDCSLISTVIGKKCSAHCLHVRRLCVCSCWWCVRPTPCYLPAYITHIDLTGDPCVRPNYFVNLWPKCRTSWHIIADIDEQAFMYRWQCTVASRHKLTREAKN